MKKLDDFEMLVLEHLPVEPSGASLADLAWGLLDNRGRAACGRILKAVKRIAKTTGGVWVGYGPDGFKCYRPLYGIPRENIRRVRALFAVNASADPPAARGKSKCPGNCTATGSG